MCLNESFLCVTAAGSSCWSGTGGLGAWLEESFGKFSIYVDYQDLRHLNAGFESVRSPATLNDCSRRRGGQACRFVKMLSFSLPQFESLDLLSAAQVAQLTLHSGALNNVQLIELVLDRLEGDNSFQDIEEFLEALSRAPQVCSRR